MIDYNKLGCCIDNVYSNIAKDPSRKVIATLNNDMLSLRYVSIVEVAKNEDKDRQIKEFEREAVEMISSYKRTLVSLYKEETNSRLGIKEEKNLIPGSYEVMTVSPYSFRKIMKFNYTLKFRLS